MSLCVLHPCGRTIKFLFVPFSIRVQSQVSSRVFIYNSNLEKFINFLDSDHLPLKSDNKKKYNLIVKVKQSHYSPWTGPDSSRKFEVLRFQDNRHMKVVRLSARSTARLFSPRKYSWYSFLLEAESTP